MLVIKTVGGSEIRIPLHDVESIVEIEPESGQRAGDPAAPVPAPRGREPVRGVLAAAHAQVAHRPGRPQLSRRPRVSAADRHEVEVHAGRARPAGRAARSRRAPSSSRAPPSGRGWACDGRRVVNVNSTATGGGVAELLQTLLAYARGAGVDARWVVIDGDAPFFEITKRIHNHLYGTAGRRRAARRRRARATTRRRSAATWRGVRAVARAGDIVLLHDPQTAGLAPPPRRHGRADRLALPRRHRRAERALGAGVGIPPPVSRRARRATCSRAREFAPPLDPARAARRHLAVDRSLLGQERRHRPDARRPAARARRAPRRRRRPIRRCRSRGATGHAAGSRAASISSGPDRRRRRRFRSCCRRLAGTS